MITFIPPTLRAELARALDLWTEKLSDQDLPDGLSCPSEWDQSSDEDTDLTPESIVSLGLRYWDDGIELTCREFVDLMDEFGSSKFLNAVGCISKNRAFWRVTPINAQAHRAMDTQEFLSQDSENAAVRDEYFAAIERVKRLSEGPYCQDTAKDLAQDIRQAEAEVGRLQELVGPRSRRTFRATVHAFGQNIEIGLSSGFNIFSLHVVASGLDHEYFPPVALDEAFIEIDFPGRLSEDQVVQLVHSYVFELSATVGCEFLISPRYRIDDDELDEYDGGLVREAHRLRPLVTGKGVADLLTIYNRGIGTTDDELKILCFTKVIEFVAQTAIRRQSTEAIHGKLMSPRAISPDAKFISELESLIDQQRVFKKDREAIRLTISLCCHATELSLSAPEFIKELQVTELIGDPKLQLAALNKFADVLYSTRNAIAHAKSNYIPTGDECPDEDVPKLALCSKRAAEQAIRWFASISDNQRVI